MQIINSIYSLPRNNYYNTSFHGGVTQKAERVVKDFNLGSFRNGKIGQIAVKKTNGEKAFLQLEKSVRGNEETYSLKDDKGQFVGFADVAIFNKPQDVLKEETFVKHVYVRNINNYSRPGEENYDSRLEEYKGIGTRFMQIALKRSEETNCHGKVELHASTDEVKNFYEKLGFVEDLSGKYREFHENKMYLPNENKDILRQKDGGLEITLF